MKILIIGGNRYFGKRLVGKLLQRKGESHEIWVLNRGNVVTEHDNYVHKLRCDRTDPAALRAAIGSLTFDVVYDQMCMDATQAKQACEIFADRTPKYVFTSSQSVYPAGARLAETAFKPETYSFPKTVTAAEDYPEAKRQAEATFMREGAFSLIAVRFPIVLGDDDYTKRLDFHIDHVARQKVIYLPNPSARISFINSQDAADTLAFLSTCEYHGPLNAASPDPIDLLRILELTEQTVGKPARLSSESNLGDQSPFGIASDWAMDSRALKRLGYGPEPVSAWLPGLIERRWAALKKTSPRT